MLIHRVSPKRRLFCTLHYCLYPWAISYSPLQRSPPCSLPPYWFQTLPDHPLDHPHPDPHNAVSLPVFAVSLLQLDCSYFFPPLFRHKTHKKTDRNHWINGIAVRISSFQHCFSSSKRPHPLGKHAPHSKLFSHHSVAIRGSLPLKKRLA